MKQNCRRCVGGATEGVISVDHFNIYYLLIIQKGSVNSTLGNCIVYGKLGGAASNRN